MNSNLLKISILNPLFMEETVIIGVDKRAQGVISNPEGWNDGGLLSANLSPE